MIPCAGVVAERGAVPDRVVVISKVSDFILFSSRITITVVASIIGNYLIVNYADSPTFWVRCRPSLLAAGARAN